MAAGEPDQPLADLWSGEFGDDYVQRNAGAATGREGFWNALLDRHGVESALEVGCNVGGNLRWVAAKLGAENAAGVDVNRASLEELRAQVPGLDLTQAPAQDLPFEDLSFDLVFTVGVLIHIAPQDLARVTGEIVRCSRRLVLCAEYFSEEEVEVPYRGHRGALFKRDFGAHYLAEHPELELLGQRDLTKDDAPTWDSTRLWLFRRG